MWNRGDRRKVGHCFVKRDVTDKISSPDDSVIITSSRSTILRESMTNFKLNRAPSDFEPLARGSYFRRFRNPRPQKQMDVHAERRPWMDVRLFGPHTSKRGGACCVTGAEGRHWRFKLIKNIKLNVYAKCFFCSGPLCNVKLYYTSHDVFLLREVTSVHLIVGGNIGGG